MTHAAPTHPAQSASPQPPHGRVNPDLGQAAPAAGGRFLAMIALLLLAPSATALAQAPPRRSGAAPRNVVFILTDDHRYDFMGFMPEAPRFLQTPNLDRMAAGGAHLANAFVTTSLCSPSRASILTGRYAHNHGVVDNTSPIPEGTRFFPEALHANGYQTAFIGKWHMGEDDDRPRPGFDRWVSFRGQGSYTDPVLNIDGQRETIPGYTTDILTDYAVDWLENRRDANKPFFLELSHKAVHAEFSPAPRHAGSYATVAIPYPASMPLTEANYAGKPRWVLAQRGSWHGVDFMFHGDLGPGLDGFNNFYRRYAETLRAADESVGRVLDTLERLGLAENTLVVYMGDNGFLLGEHGLIDKRNAYEESIRVPMLAYAPGYIPAGTVVDDLVRNIDVAPTILDLTHTRAEAPIDGTSFLSLLTTGRSNTTPRPPPAEGDGDPGREFLYEYYWEYAFPHTPTTFALRGDRYKYIYYQGIWDTFELYDMQLDAKEQHNPHRRAGDAAHRERDARPPLRPPRGGRRDAGPDAPRQLAGGRALLRARPVSTPHLLLRRGASAPFCSARRWGIGVLALALSACALEDAPERSAAASRAVEAPAEPASETLPETPAEALVIPADVAVPAEMALIPGGPVHIGAADGRADEQPVVATAVAPFLLDKTPVTVARFRAFARAARYTTDAERLGDGGVLDMTGKGWSLVAGADWQHPEGPAGEAAVASHPVTQTSYADAEAFCAAGGGRLPTEVEWEHAARGARDRRAPYAWGDSLHDRHGDHANTWTGTFPVRNTAADGYRTTSPAGAFGATDLGLTDMGGNVWEWTSSWYRPYADRDAPFAPDAESERVQRGGSFLCHTSYCHGYRVSARSHSTPDTALFNVGFRCARSIPSSS